MNGIVIAMGLFTLITFGLVFMHSRGDNTQDPKESHKQATNDPPNMEYLGLSAIGNVRFEDTAWVEWDNKRFNRIDDWKWGNMHHNVRWQTDDEKHFIQKAVKSNGNENHKRTDYFEYYVDGAQTKRCAFNKPNNNHYKIDTLFKLGTNHGATAQKQIYCCLAMTQSC